MFRIHVFVLLSESILLVWGPKQLYFRMCSDCLLLFIVDDGGALVLNLLLGCGIVLLLWLNDLAVDSILRVGHCSDSLRLLDRH